MLNCARNGSFVDLGAANLREARFYVYYLTPNLELRVSAICERLRSSLVELAKESCCSADPVRWWGVDFLADGDLDRDDVVRRLTCRRQHTTAQACLVHGARVLFWVGNVVLRRLEVDQRHRVVQFVL